MNKKELVEGFSWNKLIRRNLFNEFNIRYPNLKYEDIPTIFKVLTKINSCKFINKKLYYYVQHNASITGTKSKKNIEDFVIAVEMIDDILVEENLISVFKDDYYIYRVNCLLSEYIVSIEVIKASEELTRTFETIFQSIKINKLLKLNKPVNIKLLIKVFLYKMRLLPQFIMAYQKFKSI